MTLLPSVQFFSSVICDLCYGYDGVCIESYQMCDSMPNCPNGTDELNCGMYCYVERLKVMGLRQIAQ